MTTHRKKRDSQPTDIGQGNMTHPLARALFALRLHLKALAAILSEDDAIAHPSGISINMTEFHVDALSEVRKLASPHIRASFNRIIAGHHATDEDGSPEIVAVLRAIRMYVEAAANLVGSPHFTNEARIIAWMKSATACDLCSLALENFSIKNMRAI